MSIANCKQCGKIYRLGEVHHSEAVPRQPGAPQGLIEQLYLTEDQPYCFECFTARYTAKQKLYRYIQDNPGASIDQIATFFRLEEKDMQYNTLLSDIGTAKNLFKSKCSLCQKEVVFYQRQGHYCTDCNNIMKIEIHKARHTTGRESSSISGGARRDRVNDGHFGFKHGAAPT